MLVCSHILKSWGRATELKAIVGSEGRSRACLHIVSILDGRVLIECTFHNVAFFIVNNALRVELLVRANEVESFGLEAYIIRSIVSVILLTQFLHVLRLLVENLGIKFLMSEEVTELKLESSSIVKSSGGLWAF